MWLVELEACARMYDSLSRPMTAPRFEPVDDSYSWLNGIQAVSYGSPVGNGVGYDVDDLGWPAQAE